MRHFKKKFNIGLSVPLFNVRSVIVTIFRILAHLLETCNVSDGPHSTARPLDFLLLLRKHILCLALCNIFVDILKTIILKRNEQ